VRSVDGHELALPSFTFAADRDPLDARTCEAMMIGVATRQYQRSLDPLPAGQPERAVSKSAVSRRFVTLSAQLLAQWLARPLAELDLRVVLLDGIAFRGHCILIALGITADGTKRVLGLREGTTENATVAKALLSELIERGLPTDRALLFGIDGSKGLRKAITQTFGALALVQRCQLHKGRNVREHLPEHLRPATDRALAAAYATPDAAAAERQLERLAHTLERPHPGAAASVREGLAETLTLQRLGLTGALYQTLRSTNAIENLNGTIAHVTRNVRRWRDGAMLLRWIGTALHGAEPQFRRLRGYRDMAKLVAALRQHEAAVSNGPQKMRPAA
jgi:transposase-like protein